MTRHMTRYYVLNENTLVYVAPEQPDVMGVLAGSVIKGGYSPMNGPVSLCDSDNLRPATREDFDAYRVQVPPSAELRRR